jgi:hypothetical protein
VFVRPGDLVNALRVLEAGRLGAPRPIQAYVGLYACAVPNRAVEWG